MLPLLIWSVFLYIDSFKEQRMTAMYDRKNDCTISEDSYHSLVTLVTFFFSSSFLDEHKEKYFFQYTAF